MHPVFWCFLLVKHGSILIINTSWLVNGQDRYCIYMGEPDYVRWLHSLFFNGSKLKTSSCIRLLHCPAYFSLRTLKVTYSFVGISMVKPPLPAKSWTSLIIIIFFHFSHFSHGFSQQTGHSFPAPLRPGPVPGILSEDMPWATSRPPGRRWSQCDMVMWSKS